jgi:hypothetical protein
MPPIPPKSMFHSFLRVHDMEWTRPRDIENVLSLIVSFPKKGPELLDYFICIQGHIRSGGKCISASQPTLN